MNLFSGRDSNQNTRGGRRRRYRGGRPRVQPFVQQNWKSSRGSIDLTLSNVELEALRLIDEEKMTQEQAAEKMNISRGTLWRIIQTARNKIISALLSGKETINFLVNKEEE